LHIRTDILFLAADFKRPRGRARPLPFDID
jgi:hypothetical protein